MQSKPSTAASPWSLAELQKQHAARFQGYSFSPTQVPVQPALRCQLKGCGCEWNTFIWVSVSLRCTWFEIPKNASSSLKAATSLSGANPLGFEMYPGTPDQALAQFPQFKRFAILREPVDRIRSLHRMFCWSNLEFRQRQLQALFRIDEIRLTLAQFLRQAARDRNHHWEQMVRFLPAPQSGEVTLFRMDTCFPQDLHSLFANELGVPLDLPRINSTGRSPHSDLTPEERALIESMFAEDLKLWALR